MSRVSDFWERLMHLAKFHFAVINSIIYIKVGSKTASANAFPNEIGERGETIVHRATSRVSDL